MLQKIVSKNIDNCTYRYDNRILRFEKNTTEIKLVFKTEPGLFHHKYIPKLRIKSGLRPLPGLIWTFETDYRRESLSIRAFKEFKFDDTELFKAPFLNAHANVCLGSSEFNVDTFYKGDATEIADSVIKSFFNSAFTHTGDNKAIKGNILSLSRELIDMKEFPLDLLNPIKTINDEPDFIDFDEDDDQD